MLILGISHITHNSKPKYTFLPTVIVLLLNNVGDLMPFRAILDIGSNANVITAEAARKLGFSVRARNIKEITTTIRANNPHHNSYAKSITCSIVKEIDSPLPRDIDFEDSSEIFASHSDNLADQDFNRAGKVEIILGISVTFDITLNGVVELQNGAYLKESKLGWIVGGTIETSLESSDTTTTINLKRNDESEDLPEEADDPDDNDDVFETQSPDWGSDNHSNAYYH